MPSIRRVLVSSAVLAWFAALPACTSTSSAPSSDGGIDAASDVTIADAPSDRASEEGGSDAGSACGIALNWEIATDAGKTSAQCQTWLDQNCCAQEQACAVDPECRAFVECANRCPIPRADSCVNACGGDASTTVQNEIDAVGTCSKSVSGGEGCAWP